MCGIFSGIIITGQITAQNIEDEVDLQIPEFFKDFIKKQNIEISTIEADNIRQLSEFNEPDNVEAYPWLSDDGLRIYFIKNDGEDKILFSSRTSINEKFGEPEEIKLEGVAKKRISPWLTPDELNLYFLTDENNLNMARTLYHAQRTSIDKKFKNAVKIDLIGDIREYIVSPSFTPDMQQLFLFQGIGVETEDYKDEIMILNKTGDNEYTLTSKVILPDEFNVGPCKLTSDGLKLFFSVEYIGDKDYIGYFERDDFGQEFKDMYFLEFTSLNSDDFSNHQPMVTSNEKFMAFTRSTEDLWSSNELYIAQLDRSIEEVIVTIPEEDSAWIDDGKLVSVERTEIEDAISPIILPLEIIDDEIEFEDLPEQEKSITEEIYYEEDEAVVEAEYIPFNSFDNTVRNSNNAIVYPTPADEYINIGFEQDESFNTGTLNIYTVTGQMVVKFSVNKNDMPFKINVSKYDPAIYFYEITLDNSGFFNGKFSVSHR